jgi:CHAD domain-containing protein
VINHTVDNSEDSAEERPEDHTAGAVLHQVLARSAQKFIDNDIVGGSWGSSIEAERVHQSRVALRRMRSNLRTFRLLVDPNWGTSLRAELAWYADRLGETRDLHVLRSLLDTHGADVIDPRRLSAILDVIDTSLDAAAAGVDDVRSGGRHDHLVTQIQVAGDDPPFTVKATKPAELVLAPMLQRTWHDVRGAGRIARKKATDAHLHKLRIRLKGLRYGAETVALIAGAPAGKTARAAEALQSRLGDLHDACVSVTWLSNLAEDHPELAKSARQLQSVQEASAAATRKGWRKDLSEVERRWRKWQG